MATISLVPLSCFECNKRLELYERHFRSLLREGYTVEEALDKLGLVRPCCRTNMTQQMIVPFPPSAQEIEEEMSKLTVRDKPRKVVPATATNVTVAAPVPTSRIKQLAATKDIEPPVLIPVKTPEKNVEYRQYYLTHSSSTGNPLLWEKKTAAGSLERRAIQYQNIQGLEGKSKEEIEQEYERKRPSPARKSPPKKRPPPRKVVRK